METKNSTIVNVIVGVVFVAMIIPVAIIQTLAFVGRLVIDYGGKKR